MQRPTECHPDRQPMNPISYLLQRRLKLPPPVTRDLVKNLIMHDNHQPSSRLGGTGAHDGIGWISPNPPPHELRLDDDQRGALGARS